MDQPPFLSASRTDLLTGQTTLAPAVTARSKADPDPYDHHHPHSATPRDSGLNFLCSGDSSATPELGFLYGQSRHYCPALTIDAEQFAAAKRGLVKLNRSCPVSNDSIGAIEVFGPWLTECRHHVGDGHVRNLGPEDFLAPSYPFETGQERLSLQGRVWRSRIVSASMVRAGQ